MFSFNGLFGYTALGFAGFPGDNAMRGAIIIMATPSDTYSPVTGFDFDQPPTVQEYIIDAQDNAFRHWMTPVTSESRSNPLSNPSSYVVEETECFTAMAFNTPGIFNTTFNVKGRDDLIWAANGADMFAGYHANARGKIQVEWATGNVILAGEEETMEHEVNPDEEGGDHNEEEHIETAGSDSLRGFGFETVFAVVAATILAAF
jgi:hypothetical protein